MAEEKDERLLRYLELCKRICERMERDGTWPWPETSDSTNPTDMLDSEDSPKNDI